LGKTTGIITLAILIGATSWAVASLSTWLVPVYVTGMVLIFALPRPQPAGSREPVNHAGEPGGRNRPEAEDRPGGSNELGSAPVKGKGGAGAKSRRNPAVGAAAPADLEDPNDPVEASAQPAELPTPTAKPRKPRSRARKTAKAGTRPELESTTGTGATWIRVGPGKFIRADTQEPLTTSTAEPPGITEFVHEAESTVDAPAQPAVASEPLPSGEAVAATSPSPAEEIIESETSHDGPISSVNPLVIPDALSITACASTAEDPELPPTSSPQEESDASFSLPEEEAFLSPLAEEEVREDSEESAEQGPGQDLVPATSGTIEETAPAEWSEPGFDDGLSGTGADPLDPADLEVPGTSAEEYGIAPSAFDDDPLAGRLDPEDVSAAQLEVSVSTDAFGC